MDRQLEKKSRTPKRVGGLVGALALFTLVLYALLSDLGTSTLNVDPDRILFATVEQGRFHEFSLVNGSVMPRQTFYLTTSEGGRVEEVFIDEGVFTEEGDTILRLKNTDLELETRRQEDLLQEQENLLFNTRLQMQQERSDYGRRVAELDYRIVKQDRIYQRDESLFKAELLSELDFELSRDEYDFLVRQKELAAEEEKEKEILREARVLQMKEAVERRRSQLRLAHEKLEKLVIRAPARGQLTSLDAEIGQSKAPGQRLGQIDTTEQFKVMAQIDEHYVSRVAVGQTGEFDLAGATYEIQIEKIYPEISEGKFEIDLVFVGALPEGTKRGQTLHVRLALGDAGEALLLKRGAFYQESAGQWVYVVDQDAGEARKQRVRLGRQNPNHFEVLEGLEVGDQVIISTYETFARYDRIVLNR